MITVNELLMDSAINHQVDLARYENHLVRRMMAILNRSDDRLYAELMAALERLDASSFTVERLESLLGSVRSINAQAYAQVGTELKKELYDFVSYEAAYQRQALEAVLPVNVHVAAVSVEQTYAAALSRPFQGVLLKGVLTDLEASKAKKIREAVALGFVENKTTSEIVRGIRGTRAKGYSDGIIEITRRDAEAVVRTALGHMAGFVQDRHVEANGDLIKAVVWSSTIDLRTSAICRVRDGLQYTPVEHKPVGHKMPWLQGPSRSHWRCRSHQTYVLFSNAELGIEGPDIVMKNGTRASMDGQVPKETSYAEWLKKQSAGRQNQVLGETRGKLLREGGLSLRDMYDSKGRYFTLEELRRNDAEAFARAGL